MSVRTALGCDRCDAITAGFPRGVVRIADARLLARTEGWKRFRVRATGTCLDACPTCVGPVSKTGVIEIDEFGAKR